ncbi:MAG: helix-turn-helix domain-containing protein [Elusimicrobiota bacterium]|jgi:DNA-binding Xre family transcriptional regulator
MLIMGKMSKVSRLDQNLLNESLVFTSRFPRRLPLRPHVLVRTFRSALRMSQTVLARRSGVPQSHIARLETGKIDIQISTLKRLLDAMFCDLLILPRPRKRPSDAVAEQQLKKPFSYKIWSD